MASPKLLPQMMGEPRVKKPPLVAWITAFAMRPATLAQLDDAQTRDAAYVDLAWQVRWTGLLAGCITILATFEIGRLIFSNRAGLAAAVAVSSNLLFLKYMRQSTSDVHLAMWVTIANACFVHGLVRQRWWIGSILGAIAVAMAFLCKGPVALLETVLPLVGGIFLLRSTDRADESGIGREKGLRIIQGVLGVLLFLLLATPWFIYVYRNVPDVWHIWTTEVTRNGATDLEPGRPWIYVLIGVETWPWVVFGFVGLAGIWINRRDRKFWLPVLQVMLPLVVMVWFRDRKERYLLPMIGPAAVICGYGIALWLRGMRQHLRRDWMIAIGHMLLLLGGGIAFIVFGTSQKTVDGAHWFTHDLATWACVALLVLMTLGLIVSRRKPAALIVASLIAMMGLQALFMFGYARAVNGRSTFRPLAEAIRNQVPTATVYDWLQGDRRVEEEFAIYLNRPVLRADLATLTSLDRPAVVILRQPIGTPLPQLPTPWLYLAKINDHHNVWWAFVRYP